MGSKFRSACAWLLLACIIAPLFPVAFVVGKLPERLDPRRDRLRRLVAAWVSLYPWTSPLYRFQLEGRDQIPRRGPYVVVANHESGLDVLILLMLATPARFLADAWMFEAPWAGWFMRLCRHIPVKVGDSESGHRALEQAARGLLDGSPIAVFPEGSYSSRGLSEFKPGAFVAAKRAGVPIVPVLIEGTGAAWAPGTVVVHGKHRIRIAVQAPIDAEEVAASSVDALIERTREKLVAARELSYAGNEKPEPR
jgi:1-acyl-sn-glycerol-3-phosphate acyltransferase